MPKVTIVMPSLNVAKYIRVCMESVLKQTLQDIEILAIDAGSSDGTLEILQEYAEKDSRVQIVYSDKKSYGYQLNIGISMAAGEYVGIVETDDLIEIDMFETLYVKAVEARVDYVKGTAQMFMDINSAITVTNPIWCVQDVKQMGKILCPKKNPELFVTDRFLWMGIYKADFIKKIKLNESPGAAFQDIGFNLQVVQNADKAIYLNKNVYFYRQNNDNASSYDTRGFRYLEEEYAYIRRLLEGKEIEWYKAYYIKMMNQCLGRFRLMGMTGEFWDGSYKEMMILQSWLKRAVQNGELLEQDIEKGQWQKLQSFFESPKAVYNEYANEYNRKTNYILGLFSQISNHKIIIFGSGRYGKFFHALLENKYPGQAVAFCDNNSELWDSSLQGIPVLSPDKAVEKFPESMYVIANLRNVDAMKKQLEELGISDKKICLYQEAPDMLLFQMKEI